MERLKKNLVLALGLGLAVYLVLAVLSGLSDLRAALAGFDYFLIPAILSLVCLSYTVRFARWAYYLRLLKVRIPLRTNAAIFAAGLSMAISPGKLGEVLKSVFVKDVARAAVARTAPAVFAERATDGIGMIAWGLIGALAFSFGPWLLLLFLAFTAIGIAILRSKELSLLTEKILSKLPLLSNLAPHMRDFHGASNELDHEHRFVRRLGTGVPGGLSVRPGCRGGEAFSGDSVHLCSELACGRPEHATGRHRGSRSGTGRDVHLGCRASRRSLGGINVRDTPCHPVVCNSDRRCGSPSRTAHRG